MTQKEYLREYYRQYRKTHRYQCAKREAQRRERRRQEADPAELRYLKEFRESLGLNKSRFADALGVSKSYVSNMESGAARINHERIREQFPEYRGGRE